jgi:ferrochelatase
MKPGVLLTNVGSPDAPTPAAVRRYLREFLSDRRVVDVPRLLWWPILNGVILPLRPRRSAHAYAKIWTAEGSPLVAITRRIAAALAKELSGTLGSEIPVAVGMGYGNPSLLSGLEILRNAGCDRFLVLPLFPQYSSPTTGSSFEGLTRALTRWRVIPELVTIGSYPEHPSYIAALANSVRTAWRNDGEPDLLLLSFHGLPVRFVASGDPYRAECEATARALVAALQLPPDGWKMSFQSRFGREPWLQPYTDVTLRELGRGGLRVDVICPGFAADCLETLEEIGMQNRGWFEEAGGKRFRYIPALNDSAEHVRALAEIVGDRLQQQALAR